MKKVVLKVELNDDSIKKKAMKAVSGLPGIESVSVDFKDQKMTLIGDIDPIGVVGKLRKLCHTEILSFGPAKEEKKEKPKKNEEKKEKPKKNEEKKEKPKKDEGKKEKPKKDEEKKEKLKKDEEKKEKLKKDEEKKEKPKKNEEKKEKPKNNKEKKEKPKNNEEKKKPEEKKKIHRDINVAITYHINIKNQPIQRRK